MHPPKFSPGTFELPFRAGTKGSVYFFSRENGITKEASKTASRTISPAHKKQINDIACNLDDVAEVLKRLRGSPDFSDNTDEQRSTQATLTLSVRALETEIRRLEALAGFKTTADSCIRSLASLESAAQ